MLVRSWWICRYSLTLSMGYDGSWSNEAWERPPVGVPQRYVPRCLQQACSSTQKALLAMVLLWIWQWWRLDVSFDVHLGGVGVWRRPLVSAGAEKPSCIFPSFRILSTKCTGQLFSPGLSLFFSSMCVHSCNLILY
jgi:hypothetical protein